MERCVSVLIANENIEETKEITEKLTNDKNSVKIYTATNGKEAIDELQKNSFDLLIVDLVLAEIDGFEVIEQAKQINNEIKIIVISALSSETFIKKVNSTLITLSKEKYLIKNKA